MLPSVKAALKFTPVICLAMFLSHISMQGLFAQPGKSKMKTPHSASVPILAHESVDGSTRSDSIRTNHGDAIDCPKPESSPEVQIQSDKREDDNTAQSPSGASSSSRELSPGESLTTQLADEKLRLRLSSDEKQPTTLLPAQCIREEPGLVDTNSGER